MNLITIIKQILNIEVEFSRHSTYNVSRLITHEDCVKLINSGHGIEWQDENEVDCGLGDGGFYLYRGPCEATEEGETFFAFVSDGGNTLTIC